MNIYILRWLCRTGLLLLVGFAGWTAAAGAQEGWRPTDPLVDGPVEDGIPVSLEEVLEAARSGAVEIGIARARARAAEAELSATSAALWPTIGAEAGVLRTDDPVAAFGARLRQSRFTAADFDPAALNAPDPLDDWSAAVVLGWTPLDLSRSAGIRVARAGAEAAELSAAWTRCVSEFQAEVRYLDAVAAELLRGTSARALEAARANLAVIERRHAEGLLTMADVLQAEAAVAAARARALSAEQGVADARGRLALSMGWVSGVPIPSDDVLGTVVSRRCGGTPRADLTASEVAVRAARTQVDQVGGARLPKIEAFARVARHANDVWTDGASNWTVGLNVTVPLFTGFELSSRERAATASAEAADLQHEQRLREARARLAEVRRAVDVSQRAAEAAEAASEAAIEAARLMRRRLDQGLATTADLLAAEAQAAQLAADAVRSRLTHRRAVAQAALLDDARLHADTHVGGLDR